MNVSRSARSLEKTHRIPLLWGNHAVAAAGGRLAGVFAQSVTDLAAVPSAAGSHSRLRLDGLAELLASAIAAAGDADRTAGRGDAK